MKKQIDTMSMGKAMSFSKSLFVPLRTLKRFSTKLTVVAAVLCGINTAQAQINTQVANCSSQNPFEKICNGNFEQSTNCLSGLSFWSAQELSPDYFNSCDNNNSIPIDYSHGIPHNMEGYQKDGTLNSSIQGYIGLRYRTNPIYSEKMAQQSDVGLISGKRYVASFKANLSDNSNLAHRGLQMSIISGDFTFNLSNITAIEDKNNWITLAKTFTVPSTSILTPTKIILGFNSSVGSTQVSDDYTEQAYYYIDDVHLIQVPDDLPTFACSGNTIGDSYNNASLPNDMTVTWKQEVNGVSSNLAAYNNMLAITPIPTQTTIYKRTINILGQTFISSCTIYPYPSISVSSSSNTCATDILLTASTSTPIQSPYTIRWYKVLSNGNLSSQGSGYTYHPMASGTYIAKILPEPSVSMPCGVSNQVTVQIQQPQTIWNISSSNGLTPCYNGTNPLTTISVTNSNAPDDNNWIWYYNNAIIPDQHTKTLTIDSYLLSLQNFNSLYSRYFVRRSVDCTQGNSITLAPPSNTVTKYVCKDNPLILADLPCSGSVNANGSYLTISGAIMQWTATNNQEVPPNGWIATITPKESAVYKRIWYDFDGNILTSTTFNIIVQNPQIQLTSTTLCQGGTATLTPVSLNNLPITKVLGWKYEGDNIMFEDEVPSTYTAHAAGTYTVTVQLAGSCTATVSYTLAPQNITGNIHIVNANTNQVYEDDAPIVICPDNQLALQVTSGFQLDPEGYSWETEDGQDAHPYFTTIEDGGTASIVFYSFDGNYATVTIKVKVKSAQGCAGEITRKVIVLGKCCVEKVVVLGDPTAESTPYYENFPESPSNKYLVAGNIDLYPDNSQVFKIHEKKIYVNSRYHYHEEPILGGTVGGYKISVVDGRMGLLDIKGSTFQAACEAMWDGIYLTKGTYLSMIDSEISDSYNGIVDNSSPDMSGSGVTCVIENSTFRNNYMSVQSTITPFSITSSNFTSNPEEMKAPLDIEHNTNIDPEGYFYAHSFVRTQREFPQFIDNNMDGAMYGIEMLSAFGEMVIGNTSQYSFNTFNNIFVAGVYNSRPNYNTFTNTLSVYGSQFYYAPIKYTTQSLTTKIERGIPEKANYGIYSKGNTIIKIQRIPNGSNNALPTFNIFRSPNAGQHDLEHIGIYAEGNRAVTIDGQNQFRNLRTGIQLTGNGDNYSIKTNAFSECQTSIHINKQETSPLILGFTCNQFAKKWTGPQTAVLLEGNATIKSSLDVNDYQLGDCSFSNNIITGNSPQGNEISLGIDLPAATPNNMIFINNQMANKITYYRFENENTYSIPSNNMYILKCFPQIDADINTCMSRNGVLERVAAPSRPTTLQNSPNPASSSTLMSYELSESLTPEALAQNPVRLQIRDVTGKLWYEQSLSESNGSLELNTAHWPSGIYLGSLQHNGKVLAKHKIAIQQ
ncbi:hypothetical protein SAMN05421780_101813 [Flexibacter flexilis DSM 6793]|uniref:Por secretion system C-terminal sorting domain-containing protein n=1 Tax=Flexibacter flexilis DSM 6793 TaxID=927664 RepID=A0A1I1EHL5_9BACT|nr:hypothetical protein [Flexibacter flexilis]SFB86629.1 hypothetical protein SAMN05421780_101813 [Flexibacter flexilis DSM 6793]